MDTTREKVAVVFVDMQECYVKHMRDEERVPVIREQVRLIRECVKHDIPVVVLEFAGDGETIEILGNELRKVPRIRRLVKRSLSGFQDTILNRILSELGVKRIILAGMEASSCVVETAGSAIRLGYEIATSEDLIADNRCTSLGKRAEWYRENGLFFTSCSTLTKQLVVQT